MAPVLFLQVKMSAVKKAFEREALVPPSTGKYWRVGFTSSLSSLWKYLQLFQWVLAFFFIPMSTLQETDFDQMFSFYCFSDRFNILELSKPNHLCFLDTCTDANPRCGNYRRVQGSGKGEQVYFSNLLFFRISSITILSINHIIIIFLLFSLT